MTDSKKRIVVLGGGFAGVKCARTLRKLLPSDELDIVVFNSENHMVFHPLLAEVASGALQPRHVAASLRQLLKNIHFRAEDVLNIDIDNNYVEYEAYDEKRQKMAFDHLVIACGSTANLGLIHGMDEYAFGLKTMGDALAIQTHVMEQLEKAEVCDDVERKRDFLSFVVVGGGFSGIEVAGEINELVRKSTRFYSNFTSADIKVTVIHSRDHILPEVSPSLGAFAKTKMEEEGVSFVLKAAAARASAEGVSLKDGAFIRGRTIICTIGNATHHLVDRLDVPKNKGRIVVEPDMSLSGHKNVWAIGDCAAIVNAHDGALSPPVAQFAERQGSQLAQNIVASLKNQPTKPFSFKMLGSLCSIGGFSAVAEMFGIRISGFPAWFIWRGVYLIKTPSISQRIKVGIEWATDLIFPRMLTYLKADRTMRVCRLYFPPGDFIYKSGDSATDFYAIEKGEVEILRQPDSSGKQDILAILGAGDFFGEGALLNGHPRHSCARARTDVELVALGKNVFTEISGALKPLRDAVGKTIGRHTNGWNNLGSVQKILENIPVVSVLEAHKVEPLRAHDSIGKAVVVINEGRLDMCVVVDDRDLLIGVVTRSDLFRVVEVAAALPSGSENNITVGDIMVKDPIVISPSDSAHTAITTMREHSFKLLPVVENSEQRKMVGYVRVEKVMDIVMKKLVNDYALQPK
jgi:NADH:ubiquinone reductase (H+-translocating)